MTLVFPAIHYPKSIEQFDDLLKIFKARSKTAKRKDDSDNSDKGNTSSSDEGDDIGEKTTCNWLIVMDAI